MSEDILDQLARVNMMARDADGDWDLSPNDRAALRALLDLCGERALTPKVPATEEPALPDGWWWGHDEDGYCALGPLGRHVFVKDGVVRGDGLHVAVVLAVIARNK